MTEKQLENRNVLFHVLEGTFFMAGMVFLDQYTILTAFISQIIQSPLIISLIPAALVLGFNIPGLFTVSLVQKIERKHLYIKITGLIQRVMILILALITLSFDHLSAVGAGLISALVLFLFAGVGGLYIPAWLDLFARTVPAPKRSRVVALRNSLGAGAGIIFPALIALILNNYDFPLNYRFLFIISLVFLSASWIFFSFIKDPNAPTIKETSHLKFLPFLKDLPNSDPNFFRFVISRIIFSFCIISTSFFTVFYLSENDLVSGTILASFALALNVSKIVAGLIMGYIGDKRGNLLVYKIGIITILPMNLCAYFFPSIPLFFIVFLLLGVVLSADINTFQSFIGEFGNPVNRVFYTAVGSSMAGIFSGILPIITGALLSLNLIGYRGIFIICSFLPVVCFLVVQIGVKKPGNQESLPEERKIYVNSTD